MVKKVLGAPKAGLVGLGSSPDWAGGDFWQFP